MNTIPEALALAIRLHQAGQLHVAEPIYRKILAIEPNHPDAWHLLGVIAYQVGKHEIAVDHITRAIRLNGAEEKFHNNLGEAYRALGKTAEAAVCYQRALQLKPDYAEANNNLGLIWQVQQRLDEAEMCYRRALQLNPNIAAAHSNLGNVLNRQHKSNEALASYQRAIQLQPDFAEAHNNLGNVLKAQRKADEAIASYKRATQYKPEFAEAHYSLGIIWLEQGNSDTAVVCLRRALQLKPAYAPALLALVHGLQHLCQWDQLQELSQQAIDAVEDSAAVSQSMPVSPFYFLCLPTATTPRQQLQCARQWVDRQLHEVAEQGKQLGLTRSCKRETKPQLTICYLSSDFHAHATAFLIAELFEKHDRSRYKVVGYSYGRDDGSPMRRRLERAFDQFVDLQTASLAESARRISKDEVDILVDLKGYTGHSRSQILALRPAPIQANYLGYPGTMGASFVDYILVDDFIVPPDQQPFYTEQLVYLPGCYQANDSQREIASSSPSRAECGLPIEGFVFCSFNNSYKITPAVFEVWMDLLKSVSGSVLWLLAGNRHAPANLRKEAEARGVAGERLVFAPRAPLPEHLARHRLANLFLDTSPVNAHTTASDALWAGCPVLTLAGETFISRVAGSLLQTIGLPELITTSLYEYRQLALRLAQNPTELAELRARLQINRQTSPLFDATAFARNLERAYRFMWERHCSGHGPVGFRVSPPLGTKESGQETASK